MVREYAAVSQSAPTASSSVRRIKCGTPIPPANCGDVAAQGILYARWGGSSATAGSLPHPSDPGIQY